MHLPHRQFSFRREVLNHHTPPPIPKLSSITKTRILFVFLPKKYARLLPVLLQKWACLKDWAHCPSRHFFEPFQKLRATDNMGQCNVFSFAFCTFFKNFHVRLGKKRKSVSFSRVYVCVKAKLTFVSFFYFFLFCTFPLMPMQCCLEGSIIIHHGIQN